ncbi:MAG: hypothetical protein AB9919_13385 [Geobacteraceae bacterium]
MVGIFLAITLSCRGCLSDGGAWSRGYGHDEFPGRRNRHYFEMCVFSHLMVELKSGDLCIPGSNHFADYRAQLISQALLPQKERIVVVPQLQ